LKRCEIFDIIYIHKEQSTMSNLCFWLINHVNDNYFNITRLNYLKVIYMANHKG
jgi:hypothetical protein